MIEIVTPAADYTLLSITEVRAAVGVTDGSQDTLLTALEASIADQIATVCNVATTPDKRPTLRSEVIRDTILLQRGGSPHFGLKIVPLILSRMFITSVVSLSEDGIALTSTDYELDGMPGIVNRLSTDTYRHWKPSRIIAQYSAGFATVPDDLKAAAKTVLKARYSQQNRDALLKSESIVIPNVREQTREYWVGSLPGASDVDGPLPVSVVAQLKRFIRPVL